MTDRKRVIVDAAGYRERRREQLEQQADRAAERATETGKEIELEPMTPTERKVVHDHLDDRAGVETFSEGDEPDRCVIVAPLVDSGGDDRRARTPPSSPPRGARRSSSGCSSCSPPTRAR